jgi:hypothetical protein
MKKILSVLGIAAISFSLFGCQYFQPPAEDVIDREVTDEAAVGEEVVQDATVTITEGDEGVVSEEVVQDATVTITEGDEGGADGSLEQTASVTITE